MASHVELVLIASLVFSAAGGCGPRAEISDATSGPDASLDGAPPALADAGARDAPPARDASAVDATVPPDAPPDASASDGGTTDAGPPALHDCRVFEDRTAPDADRTVSFGSAATYAYEPACMRIAAGQSVTFSGRFTHHPFAPGTSPLRADDPPGSADTPMIAVEEGMLAVVTFPAPGEYPYHCPVHDHLGMYGVVRVE